MTTTDDSADEADDSVTATLQTGSGYTVGSQSAATVAVSDDDDVPVVTDNSETLAVSVADASAAGRGEFLRFTVSTSEIAQQAVTVRYGVESPHLVRGLDYCPLGSGAEPAASFKCLFLPRDHDDTGGTVKIAEGESSATVYIWIDRDARFVGNLTVFVDLQKVTGAKEIADRLGQGMVTE